jgi:hypothetical protein
MPNNSITIQIPDLRNPLPAPSPISPGGTVNFKNTGGKTVRVDFGIQDPFCPVKPPFDVASNVTVKKIVCPTYLASGAHLFRVSAGAEARTATLTVLSSPTPIVFPEKKPIVFPEDWVALALGIGIGLLVGFLIGRRQPVRTAQR